MSIIKPHNISLYGGNDEYDIVLRPLCDEHLVYLYKWSSDPEVLYWTEGGTDNRELSYDAETVHQIYGSISQDNLCFLVEVNGLPVGECWLQKMNLPEVKAMYDPALDVRRIDMAIGEKEYWNRGIGTQFIGMLLDLAFNGERVDVLHCFCEDYNIRSRRMWEKQGLALVLTEPLPQPQKGKLQFHYRITRQEYIARHRYRPAEDRIFSLLLSRLKPTQLCISEGKLRNVREWFDPYDKHSLDPIPLKELDSKLIVTDGHTRAVAAYLAGWEEIPVYMDTEELDMDAYAKNVTWCEDAGIATFADLAGRIVSHTDYERLWRKRCMEM